MSWGAADLAEMVHAVARTSAACKAWPALSWCVVPPPSWPVAALGPRDIAPALHGVECLPDALELAEDLARRRYEAHHPTYARRMGCAP